MQGRMKDLPFNKLMRIELLKFTMDCSKGPRTNGGQTVTTFSPALSA